MSKVVVGDPYQASVDMFAQFVRESDCVLIGCGSAMQVANGLTIFRDNDELFARKFAAFKSRYYLRNAAKGLKFEYNTEEEEWAFKAAYFKCLYELDQQEPYSYIPELCEGKDWHVACDGTDFIAQRILGEEHVTPTQGDWRYVQCDTRCTDELFDYTEQYLDMVEATENCAIPTDMLPKCPHCGGRMRPWVYGYDFLEGKDYATAYARWEQFMLRHQQDKMLFVELGANGKKDLSVRQPLWKFSVAWPGCKFVSVHPDTANVPQELEDNALSVQYEIAQVLKDTVAAL